MKAFPFTTLCIIVIKEVLFLYKTDVREKGIIQCSDFYHLD